ncbi:hypothetical protein XFLAVUS301_45100 [Xanthobacter flavus]|uniref:Uncharacterized protein n=1 Tax=Xanthobacter flavus TaxID=281 RepID=A0A9W6CLN6_XANFL|nr:hypothetical protein XFLAVUS301_45100 [Xanthobacter flavus]
MGATLAQLRHQRQPRRWRAPADRCVLMRLDGSETAARTGTSSGLQAEAAQAKEKPAAEAAGFAMKQSFDQNL